MNKEKDRAKAFYDQEYSKGQYALVDEAEKHSSLIELKSFIEGYKLQDKRCLEIGCGRGAFQKEVQDYTGADLADTVREKICKPFYQASVENLPFGDNKFDAVWSITVFEHVLDPEGGLNEIRRVLKTDGLLFFRPAWQCRSWAAEGYPVRKYKDLDLRGKLVKASIPIRDSMLFRALYIFPLRLIRLLKWLWQHRQIKLTYRRLRPNYEYYWMSDSDAVNSIDPYSAILWFLSRGDECLSHPTWFRQFFVRTGPVIFKIKKS